MLELAAMSRANEIVGQNLIKLRTARGLSQSDLGRTTTVSQKTVSNIEGMREGSAKVDTIEDLAEYFKTPIWQFFLEGMPENPTTRRRLNDAVLAMLSMSEAGMNKVFDRIDEIQALESLEAAKKLG